MPDVILVVLDHPAAAGALLDAARRLAELCGATRINALLVRTPPEAMVSPSEEVLTAQREAELRDAEANRADAVRAAFDAWAANAAARHRRRRGSISTASSNCWSRNAAGAPTTWWSNSRRSTTTARAGMPCAPPCSLPTGRCWWCRRSHPAQFGRRVAIAWRDDERATKAVLSALHCLTQAERVFVLIGTRGDAAPRVPPILAEHGIAVELHALPIGAGALGAALLAKAHELGADMLVMGAYQHSPLREFLLGGVTRHMLAHADLPMLLRH